MTCNCGKGQKHSDIGSEQAVILANQLRNVLGDQSVVEPQTVVCVEGDAWSDADHMGPENIHHVSKIVLTFHDVSDVQWVIDALARSTNRP